jgi:radical SAM superfamily enzyme with C-terminal helix-hairpin-helix motif
LTNITMKIEFLQAVEDMTRALIIDGYIDEPASLGVPPYISPQVRAVAGAAKDAGAEIAYVTIDAFRKSGSLPSSDLSIVMAGAGVPGRYLRSLPASFKEIRTLAERLPGTRMLGGPASLHPEHRSLLPFEVVARKDAASSVFDLIRTGEITNRWRTLDEWNKWMLLGADIVRSHQDFPQPLIAEIETYRGCMRYRTGGCSFCIEPLKGAPVFREPEDIIREAKILNKLGVRNLRLGAQTCIFSYKARMSGDVVRPNPDAIERLLSGIADLDIDVLHLDNADPSVIANNPDESRRILSSMVEHCTSGNVLALGMESADSKVIEMNNLNSTPDQVLDATRIMNEIGGERGENGLPRLLPGLNFVIGLDGESERTLDLNLSFLRRVLEEDLLLRRINIRQVMPIRREFKPGVSHSEFVRFKDKVRESIDNPMLQRLVPQGTVLRKIYTELREGNRTFGRQIGTYPILVGFQYPIGIGKFIDAKVVGWGQRSVTAVEFPLPVNTCPLAALESLPYIGKKRAARIARKRPIRSIEELAAAIEDEQAVSSISPYLYLK